MQGRSRPDVLLGDSAVLPLGDGHHAAPVLELPNHTRPFARPEADRMGRDLRRRPTGRLDVRLHGVDVLCDAVRGRRPLQSTSTSSVW